MDGFDIKFLILVCADRDARAVSHVAETLWLPCPRTTGLNSNNSNNEKFVDSAIKIKGMTLESS